MTVSCKVSVFGYCLQQQQTRHARSSATVSAVAELVLLAAYPGNNLLFTSLFDQLITPVLAAVAFSATQAAHHS
jgi:hypothetical protein